MASEVALLRGAAEGGVPVPAVVADATDGAALGAPAVVVERLEGETIARKLLRDDEYAGVRPKVAGECGAILAAIHQLPADRFGELTQTDPIESMRTTLDSLGEPHPAFELALRWLDRHRPEPSRRRSCTATSAPATSSSMPTGWSPSSTGSWPTSATRSRTSAGSACGRGGSAPTTGRPGGFGSREELWAAYETAGGTPVDPDAARWWEVHGTLRWGVICMVQAASHLLGISRSMELAAIGRRTCENEHDVLALLAPERRRRPPPAVEPAAGPHRPTAAPSWSRRCGSGSTETSAATTGRVRFHARVASKVLAMIERELRLGPAHAAAHASAAGPPRLSRRRRPRRRHPRR